MNETKTKIELLMEELGNTERIERLSKLKALLHHNEDMKKPKLAVAKGKYEVKTDAQRTDLGLQDSDYLEFLLECRKYEAEYLMMSYRQTYLEKAIDTLRSILRHNDKLDDFTQ